VSIDPTAAAMATGQKPRFRREPPAKLEIDGVVAAERAREDMLARLLQASDAELRRVSGVFNEELIGLIGGPDDLPWVEGAVYVARQPNAAGLLLPTLFVPEVPAAVLMAALLRAHPDLQSPIVAWPERRCVFSLAHARPVDRALLERMGRTRS